MAEQNKQPVSGAAQPGQVIAPGSASTPPHQTAKAVAPAPVQPAVSQAQPASAPAKEAETEDIPEDRRQIYQSSFDQGADRNEESSEAGVSWTASEFVAHEKSASWYGGLTLVAVIIAAFVYLLTRDIISTIVVLICAAALGVLGGKKPRQLQYQLDGDGITVGSKRYAYEMFRSFSVVPEGAFSSIVFMPLKRFAPLTTIYYAPDDEDKIINVLMARLPFEERKADAVDSLMRRIRF